MGGLPGPLGRIKYKKRPFLEFSTHCSINSLIVDLPWDSGWDQKLK